MAQVENAAAEVDDSAVRAALAGVVDPCCREREISVLDMGLLESVAIDGDHVRVDIILTSGWCPFQLDLVETITSAVDALPGVGSTDVAITLDSTWSTARMSDDARGKLQFLPDPVTVDRDRFLAARLPPADGRGTPGPTGHDATRPRGDRAPGPTGQGLPRASGGQEPSRDRPSPST